MHVDEASDRSRSLPAVAYPDRKYALGNLGTMSPAHMCLLIITMYFLKTIVVS